MPPPLSHLTPLKPPSRLKWAILFGLLALTACSKEADPKANKPKSPEKVPVILGQVLRQSVPVRVEAIGNVEPYTTVSVKSRVEGQLLKVGFNEGDAVAKGQILFQIDPRPYQAQLRQALANLARDRAQWENAKATLQRYERLLDKQYVSGEMLQTARTNVEVYAANQEADQAAIDTAKLQLEYATIRSPLSGRTGRLMVHQGNQVKADSILVVINQMQPVRVSFALPEPQLPALRAVAKQGEVKVKAVVEGGDKPVANGKLSFIDNAVDSTTGTIKLKANFDNQDQSLWAGQFVKIVVELKPEDHALVIPAQATQTGPKGTYVFVVKNGEKVEKREIMVERSLENLTVIAQGLTEGEKVVIDGQSRLLDGSEIQAKPAP